MMDSTELTRLVREKSAGLGFSKCGFAPASPVEDAVAMRFGEWISQGCNAGMHYMENYTDKRLSPQLLVEGAVSVISLAINYYPQRKIPEDRYQIAYYAYGRDYHEVVRERLSLLLDYIRTLVSDVSGRVFCDTAPVLERYWAWRSGLGWIGRNTGLIIPGMGSYFFLGEIICNVSFDYDVPVKNRCGSCRRCIDSCPSGAISCAGKLDAGKCLSYMTIENRGPIPPDIAAVMGNRIYGCDTCQKVCPWNRFAVPSVVPDFAISDDMLGMTDGEWQSLSADEYRKLFKGSAVKRAKFEGLRRNIDIVSGG